MVVSTVFVDCFSLRSVADPPGPATKNTVAPFEEGRPLLPLRWPCGNQLAYGSVPQLVGENDIECETTRGPCQGEVGIMCLVCTNAGIPLASGWIAVVLPLGYAPQRAFQDIILCIDLHTGPVF